MSSPISTDVQVRINGELIRFTLPFKDYVDFTLRANDEGKTQAQVLRENFTFYKAKAI
jgi:hypothetical protein